MTVFEEATSLSSACQVSLPRVASLIGIQMPPDRPEPLLSCFWREVQRGELLEWHNGAEPYFYIILSGVMQRRVAAPHDDRAWRSTTRIGYMGGGEVLVLPPHAVRAVTVFKAVSAVSLLVVSRDDLHRCSEQALPVKQFVACSNVLADARDVLVIQRLRHALPSAAVLQGLAYIAKLAAPVLQCGGAHLMDDVSLATTDLMHWLGLDAHRLHAQLTALVRAGVVRLNDEQVVSLDAWLLISLCQIAGLGV